MQEASSGTLYVVATPIGNLNDISSRALTILQQVDYIACEDTRRTQILLNHYGINKPCRILQAHNEMEASQSCLESLKSGQSIALVTDAGTPLVSDPGFRLVSMAQNHDLKVSPIPGPSALITALSALGVPCEHFYFYGFLPSKSKQRIELIEKLNDIETTMVFYEAPHRLKATFQDLNLVLGEERLCGLGREMTKHYEQYVTGSLKKINEQLATGLIPEKGECVIVVAGQTKSVKQQSVDLLLNLLLKELPLKSAVKITQNYLGIAKNEAYARAVELLEQKDN